MGPDAGGTQRRRGFTLTELAVVIVVLLAFAVPITLAVLISQLDARSAEIVRAVSLDGQSMAEVGARLKMTEGAVRVAVHRLRKRYRQLLRDEIAQTLADPAAVDEEMRTLFGAFSA